MNKKELIERIKNMPFSYIWDEPYLNKEVVLEAVEQLDEPEKVVVPHFVADWIEKCKNKEKSLLDALLYTPEKVNSWVGNSENQETFALAWIFGYKVEKEKRYEVILCNGQSLKTVYRQGEDRLDFEKEYGDLESFTRKQLEEAGFGWIFDCEGIKIKEVEE